MGRNFSFRTRLLLSFWIVLFLALLLPPWYYYRILTQEVLDEAQRSAIKQLNLVHWMLNQAADTQTIEDLHGWLVQVGDQVGARITYMAEGGRVVADSQVPFSEIPNLDNHANRPEIVQSQSQEVGVSVRFSMTTQRELIYVAKRVSQRGAVPAGVLRLAAPFAMVQEPLNRLKDSLLLFIALIFASTALLSYALVRRLNKPIRALIDTAEAISGKDYKRRIHFSPGQEFYSLTRSINKMAESIESHVRTITEQKQQLEAVFNAMQEGVMVLDSNGRISNFNRTFSKRIASAPRAAGRRPLEATGSLLLQKLCDQVMASTAGDAETPPSHLEIVLEGERAYDVNIVKLPDQQGDIGSVVVFHDISELKRLEKVRQDFVANVSHELRTPLTSIKGYTETLLAEAQPGPDTTHSFLQVILKNTNHMVKMVEDLLQLARLEARYKTIKLVPVNAASACLTAWKACAPLADGKSLRLVNELPEGGIWVLADFDQLVQVFRNLLENAIRYSPSEGPLTVSCEPQGEKVTFSVRDEGPGIPAQHQRRIFERFYRVEKHRSDHFGSTGLGLAICRNIIRNHGGRIWVQSPNPEETKGTTFFFTLLRASIDREPEPGSNHS